MGPSHLLPLAGKPDQLAAARLRAAPFSSPATCRPASAAPREGVVCSAARPGRKELDWPAAVRNAVLGFAAAATVVAAPAMVPMPDLMPQAQAGLLSKNAVTNARALLRYALPIDEAKAKPIRQIQEELEDISEQLRIPGSKPLGPIAKTVRKASGILNNNKTKLIAAFAPASKAAGEQAIKDLDASLKAFYDKLEQSTPATADRVKQEVPALQQAALNIVGDVEAAMVQGFPFEVPEKYANLPQLKGRATLEMEVSVREVRNVGAAEGTLRIVVDGYNAPVTAGNFVDLVDKKFYDGMDIQRADGFVVQTGDPGDDKQGYVDPATGEVRRIPFEVMVQGDKEPVYEENLEDNGRFNEQPRLPFNAYGSLALARSEFDSNSGSSQIFWLLKESELTPTGSNLLDGRYAVFGYVVDGQSLLQDMQVGDKIKSIRVVEGLELLQRPKGSEALPAAAEDAPAPA